MKTLITIITVVGITIIFVACTPTKLSTTEIVLITDSTDTFLAKPKADEIQKLFDSNDNWSGRIFKQSFISDVSINQIKEVKIEAESNWHGNQFLRENKVKRFNQSVAEILKEAESTENGKNYSAVYYTLAQALNRLSQSKSNIRILIAYTDLLEHTPEMSFYDEKQFALLTTKPEEITRYFEKQASLQSLAGIEVYIVYQPDLQNDKRFRVVSEYYKHLLESKNATVHITANL